MRSHLVLLGFLLILSASCRNEPAPTQVSADEKDLREFVRQPKEDWRPDGKSLGPKILLLIDKSKIRKGEPFGYRFEMQNGLEAPMTINDPAPSFIKDGSLCGLGPFRFYVTPPGGKERLAPCAPMPAAPEAGKAAPAAAAPAESLALTLQPGEFLLTRASGPANRFRPLLTAMTFDALGTYSLKVVYDPKGGPRAASNVVTLEVVP